MCPNESINVSTDKSNDSSTILPAVFIQESSTYLGKMVLLGLMSQSTPLVPNINLNWLLYGEGGMFVPTSSPTPTSLFDESDSSHNPTQTTVPETPPKTDILAEGMLNFDDTPVHSVPQQVANTRKLQQPTFAIQGTPLRRITEIRVFYDDQTWESFVPKK